jgi:lipoyl(octanoyl) transferase
LGTRITLLRPGVVAYDDALALQHGIADHVRAGGGGETLILLEHPPTYTFGVRGKREHLLTSAEALRARGADVVETDRGGDVTFHGPDQIVGYPIISIRARGLGPASYVRALEETIIDALATFGIAADRVPGRTGVWTGGAKVAPAKLGAIGVRVSRGVTTHGFALNVNTDLAWFAHIIPCGIADATVTSMQQIAGHAFDLGAVGDALVASFARVFDAEIAEPATSDSTHRDRSSDLSACRTPTLLDSGHAQRDALPLSAPSERAQGGEVTVGR